MAFYRRNLPHWHPEGAAIFLTWRLYGSLPVSVRNTGRLEGKGKNTARIGCATKFELVDAALDKASIGPLWLKDSRIARCMMDAIRLGEEKLGFYSLHAFVIMPNHVHLLITPHVFVSRLMNGLKGATAREANSILGRKGQRFWQDESFDHWVRSSAEFERIQAYIELNPVAARLANKPEAWPWSSAAQNTADFPSQTPYGAC